MQGPQVQAHLGENPRQAETKGKKLFWCVKFEMHFESELPASLFSLFID